MKKYIILALFLCLLVVIPVFAQSTTANVAVNASYVQQLVQLLATLIKQLQAQLAVLLALRQPAPPPLPVTPVVPSPTPLITPPPSTTTNGQIITGVAYQSPNVGEGLSVKYTQVVGGTTYYPFQPLQGHIDSETKITTAAGQTIQLSAIKIGDALTVHLDKGPCIAGVPGGPSGCPVKIYSIQDTSK